MKKLSQEINYVYGGNSPLCSNTTSDSSNDCRSSSTDQLTISAFSLAASVLIGSAITFGLSACAVDHLIDVWRAKKRHQRSPSYEETGILA